MWIPDDIQKMALSDSILKEFLDMNMFLFYRDWQLIRDDRLPALARSLIKRLKHGSLVPLLFMLFQFFLVGRHVVFPVPGGREIGLLVPIVATIVIGQLILAGIVLIRRQLKKYLPQLYRIAEGTAVEQAATA